MDGSCAGDFGAGFNFRGCFGKSFVAIWASVSNRTIRKLLNNQWNITFLECRHSRAPYLYRKLLFAMDGIGMELHGSFYSSNAASLLCWAAFRLGLWGWMDL